MKKIYFIINNVNNMVYVGSSKDPYIRFSQHLRHLKGGYHHNINLQRDYDRGIEPILVVTTIDGSSKNELILIDSFDTYNIIGKPMSEEWLRNLKAGQVGRVQSEETRKKISDSKIGKEQPHLIGNQYAKGKKHKVVSWNKGKPWTEARRLAQKNRISNG